MNLTSELISHTTTNTFKIEIASETDNSNTAVSTPSVAANKQKIINNVIIFNTSLILS